MKHILMSIDSYSEYACGEISCLSYDLTIMLQVLLKFSKYIYYN